VSPHGVMDPGVPTTLPASVACAGCGFRAPDDDPFPSCCPQARPGDDIDHVMTRSLDPARVSYPTSAADPNPFVRYRQLFRAWHRARAAGWSDERYVDLVDGLDRAIAAVDGHGFRVTPLERSAALASALGLGAEGRVWVKDETGNVSGSHKARHLAGIMIELLVAEATGGADVAERPLAIASCGNAALAAAVVARAADRRLEVFVPPSADPVVLGRLERLGAHTTVCGRDEQPGDPSVRRMQAAIAGGAVPFTCQGTENGLTIEGGETLGWEIVDQLRARGEPLDTLAVQVGGGALAAAVIAAFGEARQLGAIDETPRLLTVQTAGGWPLKRAWDRVTTRAGAEFGWTAGVPLDPDLPPCRELLTGVARHRSGYMWPWEPEPHSVAHGILDDETYDWLAVVRGMLATGGDALVVDEAVLRDANELAASATGIDVDHTGSAGLAGLLALARAGALRPDARIGVLFTGARRHD
jgi:threonine synthase